MSHETAPWLNESATTYQLTEYLAAVSSCADVTLAAQRGVERATEALEAEAGAIVRGNAVIACTGFAGGHAPATQLARIAAGALDVLEVPGVGSCAVARAALQDDHGGQMILARRGKTGFTSAEENLLGAMARVLALTLRTLQVLSDERTLRGHSERQAQENARLLSALRERQVLLERLAQIQRSIVDRVALEEVLDAVVAGVTELLGDEHAGLRVGDPEDPGSMRLLASRGLERALCDDEASTLLDEGVGGRAIRERRLVVSHEYATEPAALPALLKLGIRAMMAAPLWENGKVTGTLAVASPRPDRAYDARDQEVLQAFAEHASLALTDAKNYSDAAHGAFHDLLTGLPNRARFLDRLANAIWRGERAGTTTAVLFIDLDGFKRINDSLGHAAGDEMLIEVASRLDECLRPTDTAARFGGDEFAILLEDLSRGAAATMVASRIMASLQAPVLLGGRSVVISASVGVALHRQGEQDLLRDADLAMYRAKSLGKNRYEVFDPALHTTVMAHLRLEIELQRAVEQDEFRLQFQPIVGLAGGAVAGLEALVRWQHPQRGLLYPNDFIPVAEETRLISAIGRLVLNRSCRQAVRWQCDYPSAAPLAISVNLSVNQLKQPGLIYEVGEALERSGLEPSSLILEITETLLMDDVELMAETLDGLKRLGVQLAVDDFGTGYSSLQYLRRFPIDILKIAKPFVDGIVTAGESTLARVIIDLGQGLGLRVIAEGIEDAEQVAVLQRMGCLWGQGYRFARPMDVEAVSELLSRADQPAGWPQGDDLHDRSSGADAAIAAVSSSSTDEERHRRVSQPLKLIGGGAPLVEKVSG